MVTTIETSSDKVMKVFIPFLKATSQVLEEITQETFTKKNIYSFQGNITVGQVKVEIGIVGDIQTRVIFDFPIQFARDLTAIMMGVAEESEINDDLVVETCQEIGNMISGNALGVLEENSIFCDITPPTVYVIAERDVEISDRTSIGVIELISNIGEFNIYVVINESDSLHQNINILTFNLSEETNNLLSRFFFPKGIGIIPTNRSNIKEFIEYYQPAVLLIDTNQQDIESLATLVKETENWDQMYIASFGGKEIQSLQSSPNYLQQEEITDSYNFVEKVKGLTSQFKIKVFANRKEYIVNVPLDQNVRCVLAVTTKNGDYEEIPIIRLGLESIIIDITNHTDINFPEEKSLTNNVFLKFSEGVTAPIAKLKIGKTLKNGTNVQVFLEHILETEISKITDFMYQMLSLHSR